MNGLACRQFHISRDGALLATTAVRRAADLCKRRGEIMSIGRSIIVPVVLALTMTGSVIGGVAASASAAQASTVAAHSVTAASTTSIHYHT